MAKIITLQILVDDDDEARIADGLNDMLRCAAQPVDPDDADARSWIVDWRLAWAADQLLAQPVSATIADAICNDTYSEGDAFQEQDVPLLPGFQYRLATLDAPAMDSLLVTVDSHLPPHEGGDLSVLLKRTHEGVIVDIWPAGLDGANECIATAAVAFSDVAAANQKIAA